MKKTTLGDNHLSTPSAAQDIEQQLSAMPAETLYSLMARTSCILQFLVRHGLSSADRQQMLLVFDKLYLDRDLHEWLLGGRHSVPGIINQNRFASLLGLLIDYDARFHHIRKRDMARHLGSPALDVVPFNPFLISQRALCERMSRQLLIPHFVEQAVLLATIRKC